MTTGLYLGKFAPLHKGHEYMIQTALDECDTVIVLIYDTPDVIDIPVTKRADWIRRLYPETEVIIAWTGPEGTGQTKEKKQAHEEYVISRLNGRNIDKFYSSEFYGEHMSDALNAEDRRIDPNRNTVSISGTQIRNNPYENKEYVSDSVYKDLITNVVFLGGPSTGKSTLTQAMANEFNTEYMHEYGREYWNEHNIDRRLTQDQLLEIATGHLERENKKLENADTYLFTDTNAITTYVFSKYYHDNTPEELHELARNCDERYDIVILCGMDIPYDDTWDRSGPDNRKRLQRMHIDFLERHNIPYYTVTGTVEERVQQVKDIVSQHEQYDLKKQL